MLSFDSRANTSGRPEDREVAIGKPQEVRLSFLGLADGLTFGEVCVGNQILVMVQQIMAIIMARRQRCKTKTAILPSRTWPAKQVTMLRKATQATERKIKPRHRLVKVTIENQMKRHVAQMRSGSEGDDQSTLSPAPLPRSLFFPFASNPFPALPALPPKIPAVWSSSFPLAWTCWLVNLPPAGEKPC
jgi:hypothetical protein